jgi:hypothetical protein
VTVAQARALRVVAQVAGPETELVQAPVAVAQARARVAAQVVASETELVRAPVRVVARAAVAASGQSAVGKELPSHSRSDIMIDVGS